MTKNFMEEERDKIWGALESLRNSFNYKMIDSLQETLTEMPITDAQKTYQEIRQNLFGE